jgi:small multidrug resistance family-3 protein
MADLLVRASGNDGGMTFVRAFALFVLTALAEIVGCYLPYLWLRQARSVWLLVPTALSLGVFSWLLTLHPTAAGRTYAAYGGVYVSVAIVWLWLVEKQTPKKRNVLGVALCLVGMAVIATGPSALEASR